MVGPNIATITASLERSLQNCSLTHQHSTSSSSGSSNSGDGGGRSVAGHGGSATSDSPKNHSVSNSLDSTTLELNSHISLPYHWEQCLDLKTGEIYYINWRTGMKSREDPRNTVEYGGEFDSDDDSSSYEGEESSSEHSPCCSREQVNDQGEENNYYNKEKMNVLVVAGCKSCFMYHMVPKKLEVCPKCGGQLLHFDGSENSSP